MDGPRNNDQDPSEESFTVPDRQGVPGSPTSAPLFTAGTVLAERYELGRILGRGGMGVVFEAYDRILAESVAIKIVRAEYAGEREWAERLAREVKLARQINHANVCRVFDFGQADAHPFLIMELAGRGTLRDELTRGEVQKRPVEGRLSDARTLASGLAAIHAAGIVHRDIAPQNALRMDDGRLVLSDFGLAVDHSNSSSSLHGGTVAYMAPEVVRGERASFASDIWSLGVVIHEAVFSVRPRWSANGRDMLPPELGRPLTAEEKTVVFLCRACVNVSAARRPHSAGVIEDALRGRGSARWRRSGASVIGAATLLAIALLATGVIHRRSFDHSDSPGQPSGISPQAEPVDWSSRARILASVPGKVHCMAVLPDRKTLRFVWGIPRRAEDLDTQTGQRVPSPLLPATYAESCPDLSPDGSKLVFAGHDRDRRPVAFVSRRFDGADATAVVATGEPSMSTDPAWFPDSDSFLYPLDLNHSAIYSMKGRSSTVVSADTHLAYTTSYFVAGNAVLVTKQLMDGSTELLRRRFPHLDEDLHLRISAAVLDPATPDGQHYYMSQVGTSFRLLVVDAARVTVTSAGAIPGTVIRNPRFTSWGLAFVATTSHFVILFTSSTGAAREVDAPAGVRIVSQCGGRLIGTHLRAKQYELVWMDWSGRLLGRADVGRSADVARCSTDGQVVYVAALATHPGLARCERGQCRDIYQGAIDGFDVSPDGQRIVILAVADDGMTVRWLRADGLGPVHDIASAQVACVPGWSSATNVWMASRSGTDLIWRELSADTSMPTGRTAPGSWDCMDGMQDPASPVLDPVRVVVHRQSQIRFVPSGELPVD